MMTAAAFSVVAASLMKRWEKAKVSRSCSSVPADEIESIYQSDEAENPSEHRVAPPSGKRAEKSIVDEKLRTCRFTIT